MANLELLGAVAVQQNRKHIETNYAMNHIGYMVHYLIQIQRGSHRLRYFEEKV